MNQTRQTQYLLSEMLRQHEYHSLNSSGIQSLLIKDMQDSPMQLLGLKALYKEYSQSVVFTLADIVSGDFDEIVNTYRDIDTFLGRCEQVDQIKQIHKGMAEELAFYGVDSELAVEFCQSGKAYQAARVALAAVNDLHLHRFSTKLKTDDKPMQYIKEVMIWNTLADCVAGFVDSTTSNIGLNVITGNTAAESYFVITLRTGSNLFLFCDVNYIDLNLNKNSNETVQDRIKRFSMLPYRLINNIERNALIESNSHVARPVFPIAELHLNEILGLIAIFNQMIAYSSSVTFNEAAPSFLGTRLVDPVQPPTSSYLPVVINKLTAIFPPIKPEQVYSENYLSDAQDHPLFWIEQRYRHDVPDFAFNFLPEDLARLPKPETMILKNGAEVVIGNAISNELGFLRVFDARQFGTVEELAQAQVRIARHNYLSYINFLAQKDLSDVVAVKQLIKSKQDHTLDVILNESLLQKFNAQVIPRPNYKKNAAFAADDYSLVRGYDDNGRPTASACKYSNKMSDDLVLLRCGNDINLICAIMDCQESDLPEACRMAFNPQQQKESELDLYLSNYLHDINEHFNFAVAINRAEIKRLRALRNNES